MALNLYRSDKIELHQQFVQQLCRGQHPPPIRVQLVLADLCNQNCGFCAYRMEGYSSNQLFFTRDDADNIVSRNPHRFLPKEKALEVVRDCRDMGVKALELTGGGEPTVHPDLDAVIALAKESGLDVGLVTNGVRLKASTIVLMAQRGVESWIRVSVDAGTPETYSSIRRCSTSHWDIMWKNVRNAIDVRSGIPGSPLVVSVSFIMTRENWKEVVLAAALARDAGVDAFRIAPFFQNDADAYFADFIDEASALCDEAAALSTSRFSVQNQLAKRIAELSHGHPTNPKCSYQRAATYIGADSNVYRCCVNAYNDLGVLGSIEHRSFKDVWEGVGAEALFETFDARQCSFCPFSDRQVAIEQACSSSKHGSFV